MSRRDDPRPDPRRAGLEDRDADLYARKRRRQQRERERLERREYDPSPPAEDEWTVPEPDTDGLRRIRRPTPVGDSLGTYLERRGWRERLRAATAWRRWEDVVGPELAQRCEPVRLAGRTLVVRTDSQVWATQLRYMLPQLRQKAEAVLGPGTVTEVRIVVGPLEGRETPERGPE